MKSILLIALLAIPAQAEEHKHIRGIKLCPNAMSESAELSIFLRGWHSAIPLPDRPTETTPIKSSWDKLTCEVSADGDLALIAQIPAEAFPLTQVPEVATCTATDSRGDTHILEVRPILRKASDMDCWERADAWYAYEPTLVYRQPGRGVMMALPLLSGYDFQDGTYQAKRPDGTTFDGVTCEVTDNGTDMTLTGDPETEEGEGYCGLSGANGLTYKVGFDIIDI